MPNSDNDNDTATSAGKKKPPLIEVLSSMSTEDKVVNGNGNGGGEVTSDKLLPETRTGIVALNMEKSISGLGLPTPRWRWMKEEGEGRRLKIEIEVPNLVSDLRVSWYTLYYIGRNAPLPLSLLLPPNPSYSDNSKLQIAKIIRVTGGFCLFRRIPTLCYTSSYKNDAHVNI